MRSKVGRLVLSLLILFALNFGPRGVVAEGENGSDGESKPSTPEEEGEKVQIAHEYVGINSLVFVAIVVACLFIGRILKKRQIYWMPQSSASMLVGFLVGIVLSFFGEEEISYIAFEPNVFFFIILPAIIFDAGYSLKKRDFFRNIGTILLFAVLGTVMSTVIIGLALYGFAKIGMIPLDPSNPSESLMFGSLISSIDPVATLSILGDESMRVDPLLYSLVFGESVLNDAVSIVLFKIFEQFAHVDVFEGITAWTYIGKFSGVSFGSILIGVVVGLLCCFMFRHLDFTPSPPYEFVLTFLFAYASYCLAEIMGLSGIMALFFCGICISHYNFYNMSRISQASMKHVVHSIALVAETFLYIYLGLTAAVSSKTQFNFKWSPIFIIVTLILCFLSRAFNIFPFSFLANLRRSRKISREMQILMWFAGLRGAVSFGLALSAATKNRPYIVTTTLTIVVITTFVMGGFTERLLRFLGLRASENERLAFQSLISPPNNTYSSESKSVSSPPDGVHRFWKNFDNYYMRDWFGGPDAATRRQNTSMSMSEEMLMEIRQIDEAFENSQ